jgi:phosphoribosyl-ATP pyrophosphohydrolase/phosphoribosyl-AMP cyclohydrolase
MRALEPRSLDWTKSNGLIPAVIQHAADRRVLMVGYMNAEALRQTLASGRVTFFSRSKNRLWVKGETSGNFLDVVEIAVDCDQDTLLIQANPVGPACHLGTDTCFEDGSESEKPSDIGFLVQLERIIADRIAAAPDASYTARLWKEGITRMAQKVGEEGVEVALAAATQDEEKLTCESADLLFHLLLLLKSRNRSLADVARELQKRHAVKTK